MKTAPQRGDLVWVSLSPTAGHEQAGRRPAIVLSPRSYNEKIGVAIMCPVTSNVKGYPFEVPLPPGLEVEGAILSDQVRSIDWRGRGAERIGQAPHETTQAVLGRLGRLLSP
jgi:mRNA interferase MazF